MLTMDWCTVVASKNQKPSRWSFKRAWRSAVWRCVDAGIKGQHFRRPCSQRKPAIGQEAVPTLHEILNFSLARHTRGTTIEQAPNGSGSWWTGRPLERRAPHTDGEVQSI